LGFLQQLDSARVKLGAWLGGPLSATRSLGSHRGASNEDRAMADWDPVTASADADNLGDAEKLRVRGRSVVRDFDIARGLVQTLRDNVVGTGPRMSSRPDYAALGKDLEWAKEFAKVAEAGFRNWAGGRWIDRENRWSLGKLTEIVLSSVVVDGEVLGLLYYDANPAKSKWATRVQLMEADRLCTPDGKQDGAQMRGGVELDSAGAPIAYHILKAHPGDQWLGMGSVSGLREWDRVPAETDWGRRIVLHVFDPDRPGASRGVSWMAAILPEFRRLGKYTDAEISAAITQAMVAFAIKTPMDQQMLAGAFGQEMQDLSGYQGLAAKLAQAYRRVKLNGPMVLKLNPADELQTFQPQRNAQAFATFCEFFVRKIGVGLGLPYELTFKDFSKTNYSSARAALLEAWRAFKRMRRMLEEQWLQPLYVLWLEEAVVTGKIEAPGFYDNIEAYSRCRWIWPPRGWIDPVKEAEAAKTRMATMVSTLEDEAGEQGYELEELIDQRRREKDMLIKAGLWDDFQVSNSKPNTPARRKIRSSSKELRNEPYRHSDL
jgi:lambda family phage portal protein